MNKEHAAAAPARDVSGLQFLKLTHVVSFKLQNIVSDSLLPYVQSKFWGLFKASKSVL